MKLKSYILILCVLNVFLTACNLSNTEVKLSEDYFRIFNVNPQLSYEANDIQLLDDGGYLIYATAIVDSSEGNSLIYSMPYFLKIDQFGVFQWDTTLISYRDNRDKNQQVDNSRKRLAKVGSKFFFTGYPQDLGDKQIRLLSFDESTLTVERVFTFNAIVEAVDLVGNPNSGGFYASVSRCFNAATEADQAGLFYFDIDGNVLWEKDLGDSYMCRRFTQLSQQVAQPTESYQDVGYLQTEGGAEYVYVKTAMNEEVEDREFNLFVLDANTGDSLFRNNFTDIQIIFDGDGSDLQTGMPIHLYVDGDDSLRLATANFTTGGEEVLFPTIEVQTGKEDVNFTENEFSSNELQLGTEIDIQAAEFDGLNILLYGGTTREGRILIAAFNQANGALLNKKYFGHNSYYELGGVRQTIDKGFIIVGHTITAGRFKQLCVFKVSQSRFSELLFK